jgi:hypothetical protein
MPTRVERLKKRSTKVADKAVKKMKKIGGSPTNSNRSGNVLKKAMRKGRTIDRKIIKVKARNLNRADKKDARVAKRAVKKDARVTKRAVKKDTRALNRRIKKAAPSAAARTAYKATKAAKMKAAKMKTGQATPSAYSKMVSTNKR